MTRFFLAGGPWSLFLLCGLIASCLGYLLWRDMRTERDERDDNPPDSNVIQFHTPVSSAREQYQALVAQAQRNAEAGKRAEQMAEAAFAAAQADYYTKRRELEARRSEVQ